MQQIAAMQVQAGPGTVTLAGKELPIVGQVHVQDLARFQSKVTFGDYSEDSDPLLSTWILSSFTGGIGNEYLKEGVDDETYWTGTAETRYPRQLSLGAYTWRFPTPEAGTAAAYPLADFPLSAPSFWAAFDTRLARYDATAGEFVITDSLPGVPVNKAVVYGDVMYIPLGASGYAMVDTSGVVTTAADPATVVAFCLWDNKLAALTSDGYVRLNYDGTWEAAVDAVRLPPGTVGRHLVVYVNQRGDPTLHIVTNRDVYAYDRENNLLYRTQLQFPAHPDQGLGATNWRGESLYVSVGLGIHAYNGGIVSAMGPDGRYGLPANLRGVITDLEPEYNSLIAVVRGSFVSEDSPEEMKLVGEEYRDRLGSFRNRNALSCVLRWTSYGWHPVWQAEQAGGVPTRALVSEADNAYRLWWGFDGEMYMQELPRTFFNPKQGMKVGATQFRLTDSLTTGRFDADMPAFEKLAAYAEMRLEDVFGDGTSTGTVTVLYQVDDEPGWKVLGTADKPGRTVFRFDPDEPIPTQDKGLRFRDIRYRFELAGVEGNPTLSPVMVSFQTKFIKLPLSQLSFRFTVDLSNDQVFGEGAQSLTDFLRDLAVRDDFYELIHRDRRYRVRVSQTQGSEQTGYDKRAGMVMNVVEVRIPESEVV